MTTTYEMQEFSAAAKLVFDGERFVSLPKIADMLGGVLWGSAPLTMEDVSLTSMLLQGTDVAVLLDLSFEGSETVLSLWTKQDNPNAATVAAQMARMCHALARSLPVSVVIWGKNGTRIPRDAYVAALADFVPKPETATVSRISPRGVNGVCRSATPPEQPRPGTDTDGASLRSEHTRYDAPGRARPKAPHATPRPAEAPESKFDMKPALPPEARLAAWAVSLSAASLSLPVAAPVMVYNILHGEDLRAAALSLGLAGFFFALAANGAVTHPF